MSIELDQVMLELAELRARVTELELRANKAEQETYKFPPLLAVYSNTP